MTRLAAAFLGYAIASLPLVARSDPPVQVMPMGGDVVYERLPDALPVQPARAVGGKRDWSIDTARLLAELDASCRTTDIGRQMVSEHSVVRCVKGHLEGRGDLSFYSSVSTVMTAAFRHGIVNGKARIVPRYGLRFEGTLRDNVAEGPGVITEVSGTRVSGVFTAGVLSGNVRLDFPDGSHSEAVFADGGIDGPTVLTFANGTRFEYTVRGTRYVGPATMRFADGSRLEFFYGPKSAHDDGGAWGNAVYRPAHGDAVSGEFIPAEPDLGHWAMPAGLSILERRLMESGTVTLAFTIGTDGAISDLKIHESSGSPRLDANALTAAAAWRYYPASVAGRPIAISTLLSLVFRVQAAPIVTAP